MTNMSPNEFKHLEETLENLVDAYGIKFVVSSLENVCYEKAEHLDTNWQDYKTGGKWRKIGRSLGKVFEKASKLFGGN